MDKPSKIQGSFFFQEAVFYSGLSFIACLLTFVTQAVFSRTLAPGEFGTLSAALGLVLLLGVPLSAVNQTLVHYLAAAHAADRHEEIGQMRLLAFTILKMTAWGTGLGALVIVTVFPKLLFSFRPLLQGAVLVTALTLLTTTLSGALCLGLSRFRLWGTLIIAAALLRLILAMTLTSWYPRAETALVVTAVSALITSAPVCWRQNRGRSLGPTKETLWRGDFLPYLAASFSVMLALFLFSSGDQISAQYCFGGNTNSHDPGTHSNVYDDYQAAGLMGRALIWATAPILAVVFTQVSRETFLNLQPTMPQVYVADNSVSHSFLQSLQLLVLYFGTLLLGAVLLGILREIVSTAFQGHASPHTAHLIIGFIAAMVPLGMLQAIGVLCLASKYLAECFALGAGALAYAGGLCVLGKNPERMLTIMFVGASGAILLMILISFLRRCGRWQK